MLTGARLFAGDDTPQIMHNVVHVEHEPPSRIKPELPSMLDFVVARALKKDPAVRYQDAYELSADLGNCLAELARQGVDRADARRNQDHQDRGRRPDDAGARGARYRRRLDAAVLAPVRSVACARSRRPVAASRKSAASRGLLRRLVFDAIARRFFVFALFGALAGGWLSRSL